MYINSGLNIVKRCSLGSSSSNLLLEPPDYHMIQFECVGMVKNCMQSYLDVRGGGMFSSGKRCRML